jgi:hypothetical protein
LEGKKLKADLLVRLLTEFAANRPRDVIGLQIETIRSDDLTGVIIRASFINGNVSSSSSYQSNSSVLLSGQQLHYSSGVGLAPGVSEPKHWRDFAEAVSSAVGAPPEKWFQISVRLTLSE